MFTVIKKENKMKKIFVFLLMISMGSSWAHALTASFSIKPGEDFPMFVWLYTEPSTNNDGTPLLNLDSCSVWYSIDGRETEAARVTASSPKGGQDNSWTGFVAVQPNTVKDVLMWGTCSNNSNHTPSDKSTILTIHVDRTNVVPMPPH